MLSLTSRHAIYNKAPMTLHHVLPCNEGKHMIPHGDTSLRLVFPPPMGWHGGR